MINDVGARFEVGDEVIIISSGKRGIIKSLNSYLGNESNLYVVEVMGLDKICVESNLRMCRKKNIILGLDVKEMGINFILEDRINEIISELNLKTPIDEKDTLVNACKLQRYLATKMKYDDNIVAIGNDILKNQLYHGLFNGDTDPISNSYIFSEILRRVGVDVLSVAMKLKDSSYYVANLVLIENDYYYFDVTLEKEIFKGNGANIENFVLCCGALGSESYEQFFKPLCLIDFNDRLAPNNLPNNISVKDLDIDLVNKLMNMEK